MLNCYKPCGIPYVVHPSRLEPFHSVVTLNVLQLSLCIHPSRCGIIEQDPDQRPTAREVIGILEGMRTCYLNNRMDDDEDEDDNASMHSTIEHDESLYASQRFAPESDEPRPWLAVSAQSSVAASPQQEGIRLKSLDDSLISIDRSGPSHGNHPLLLRQQPIDEMGDDGDLNV
eukprot:TRINITY_DN12008_c0_g1_i5.p2 TRINITY_DN12008_c0_g1~~TRINITY_DN12008_c0_g1_i5.p2  ORF type:complete len:173 (+),score=20.91 TRINITY_DN12008_c0_g1_i5:2177-2695(+)